MASELDMGVDLSGVLRSKKAILDRRKSIFAGLVVVKLGTLAMLAVILPLGYVLYSYTGSLNISGIITILAVAATLMATRVNAETGATLFEDVKLRVMGVRMADRHIGFAEVPDEGNVLLIDRASFELVSTPLPG